MTLRRAAEILLVQSTIEGEKKMKLTYDTAFVSRKIIGRFVHNAIIVTIGRDRTREYKMVTNSSRGRLERLLPLGDNLGGNIYEFPDLVKL